MIVSVPCSAPTTPPLIGASRSRAPASFSAPCNARSMSGKVVLITQTIGRWPDGMACTRPRSPSMAAVIWASLASSTITTSAVAQSATSRVTRVFSAANPSSTASLRSQIRMS